MDTKTARPYRVRRIVRPEVLILYYALRDYRTPFYAKLPAIISLIYLISPIDIIPDFIPVFGYVDDVVVVSLLLNLSVRLLPRDVREDSIELALRHARWLKIMAALAIAVLILLLVWVLLTIKHLLLHA